MPVSPTPQQPVDYFDRAEETILDLHLAGRPVRDIALEVLRNCTVDSQVEVVEEEQVFEGDVFETDLDLGEVDEYDWGLLKAAGVFGESEEVEVDVAMDDEHGGLWSPTVDLNREPPPPALSLADQLLASEIGRAVAEAVEYVTRKWGQYLDGFTRPGGTVGRPNALSPASVAFLIRALDQPPGRYGYPDDGHGWTAAKLLDCLWRWGDVRVSESTLRRVIVRLNYQWDGRGFVRLDEADAATKIWSRWQPGTAIGATPVKAVSRYVIQMAERVKPQLVGQDGVLVDGNDLERVGRRPVGDSTRHP